MTPKNASMQFRQWVKEIAAIHKRKREYPLDTMTSMAAILGAVSGWTVTEGVKDDFPNPEARTEWVLARLIDAAEGRVPTRNALTTV